MNGSEVHKAVQRFARRNPQHAACEQPVGGHLGDGRRA